MTSRFGSERTLVAAHNARNQEVVASRDRRATLNECAISDMKQNKCSQVLGLHKNPNFEVTPFDRRDDVTRFLQEPSRDTHGLPVHLMPNIYAI
jgi:hypothetical protein